MSTPTERVARASAEVEPLVRLLGYDRALFVRLAPAERVEVARACEGATLSALLLSASPGYVAFLLTHAYWAAALSALVAFVFVINLLRLTAAGGGRAPSDDELAVRAHSPALSPIVLLGALGLLFAQPAQLPLWSAELTPVVAHERARLLKNHTDVHGASAEYTRELAACEFLVLRLRSVWQEPRTAGSFSALYLLLVLVPMWFTRASGRRGLAAYELLRWRKQRTIVRADSLRTQRQVAAALAPYHVALAPAADPFGPAAAHPLRMDWPVPGAAR